MLMNNKDFKELVLVKAKEIFIAHGYKKTTMDDVAKACNKSKGLIYHHYNSKEEIFKIIYIQETNKFISELKIGLENLSSVKEKFYYFFKSINSKLYDSTSISHKVVVEVFDYIDIIKNELEKSHISILNIIKSILQEGIEKDIFKVNDLEKSAVSLLQMVIGFIYTPFGEILKINISKAVDIDEFINIIYSGIEKH
jgi:AcrR family transcriptional regulator